MLGNKDVLTETQMAHARCLELLVKFVSYIFKDSETNGGLEGIPTLNDVDELRMLWASLGPKNRPTHVDELMFNTILHLGMNKSASKSDTGSITWRWLKNGDKTAFQMVDNDRQTNKVYVGEAADTMYKEFLRQERTSDE